MLSSIKISHIIAIMNIIIDNDRIHWISILMQSA